MLGELAAGALAGLAVAMPVGAIGAYLLGLAARERFAVAAAAALGVASVDGAYALVASLGGAGLRAVRAVGVDGAHLAGRPGPGRPGRAHPARRRSAATGRRPRRWPGPGGRRAPGGRTWGWSG